MHKISPSFTNIGIPDLSNKLQKIEAAARQSNKEMTEVLLQQFEDELEEYMPAIVAEHQRLKEHENS
jgi:hypothetical protein